MTLKQIEANKNNALKSTGPKTQEGKANSKMNAMKHGIRSNDVVVRGLCIKESRHKYDALRQYFWEEMAPVGPLEAKLVDQIVACHWRHRRVLMAESGEITLSVDNGY